MDKEQQTTKKQDYIGKFINTSSQILKNATLKINLPLLSYEIKPEDFLGPKSIDERLQRLNTLKADLQASISAVEELENEAYKKKREVEDLEVTVKRLNEEKTTTESILRVPEETLQRVFFRAFSKGRWRGILEGVIIGLFTGGLTSFLVWFFTRPQ